VGQRQRAGAGGADGGVEAEVEHIRYPLSAIRYPQRSAAARSSRGTSSGSESVLRIADSG
jgi:hypothetical protein